MCLLQRHNCLRVICAGSLVASGLHRLVGLFMCMICGLCFPSTSGLGRHHQATGHAPAYAQLGPPKRTRNRYSFNRKRDLVLEVLRLTTLYNGNAGQARKVVANRSGANTSNLDKWVRSREFIFKCARTRRLGGKYRWCAHRPRGGRLPKPSCTCVSCTVVAIRPCGPPTDGSRST